MPETWSRRSPDCARCSTSWSARSRNTIEPPRATYSRARRRPGRCWARRSAGQVREHLEETGERLPDGLDARDRDARDQASEHRECHRDAVIAIRLDDTLVQRRRLDTDRVARRLRAPPERVD